MEVSTIKLCQGYRDIEDRVIVCNKVSINGEVTDFVRYDDLKNKDLPTFTCPSCEKQSRRTIDLRKSIEAEMRKTKHINELLDYILKG